MPKMRTFLPAMCPAFFMRVRPASRNAKPACMNITRTAVTTTQVVDAAISRSCFVTCDPRSIVGDVRHRCGPDEAVARLVAAARGVGDRGDDLVDDVVLDDEQQQRLREEPRLEDAASVLVRHAPLATVTDRFEDGDADM